MNGGAVIGAALLAVGAADSLLSIAMGHTLGMRRLLRIDRDQAPILFWGHVAFSGTLAVIGALFIINELVKRLAA